jgi:hypothetical protein
LFYPSVLSIRSFKWILFGIDAEYILSIVLATLSTKSSLSLAFCSASSVKQVIQIAQCYCNAPRPCTSVTKKTVVAGKNTPELYVSHSRLVFFINLHFSVLYLKSSFLTYQLFFIVMEYFSWHLTKAVFLQDFKYLSHDCLRYWSTSSRIISNQFPKLRNRILLICLLSFLKTFQKWSCTSRETSVRMKCES